MYFNFFSSHANRAFFVHFIQAEEILSKVKESLRSLNHTEIILRHSLETVYDAYTATEWMDTYVQPYISLLNHMSGILQKLANITEWGPRYTKTHSQNSTL